MERSAGILLPISCIPSSFGTGDFGETAYAFADFIARAKLKIWQILPLNPIGPGASPYASDCGKAIDPLYISLNDYFAEKIIPEETSDYENHDFADLEIVKQEKLRLLRLVFNQVYYKDKRYITSFMNKNPWVKGYAVFLRLKAKNENTDWWTWEEKERYLAYHLDQVSLTEDDEFNIWCQYIAFKQFEKLKKYINKKGIKLFGDLPFYVGANSYDAWANQDEFLLDERDKPCGVAGVPPDYFSKDGQRWGNLLYDWQYMKEDGFTFWKDRILNAYDKFDILRIDHFRAFDTYWNINPDCDTAIDGVWEHAEGDAFFEQLFKEKPNLQLIAEDLGDLFPSVHELRDKYNLPGMNVFEFTVFDKEFEVRKNQVIYPGTHDNNTIAGWLKELTVEQKADLEELFNSKKINKREKIEDKVIEYVFSSECDIAIVSIQDFLGLGAKYRLNTPGVLGYPNWCYYLNNLKKFTDRIPFIEKIVDKYGR
jgi:4-alpha-glucanotransferase